MFVIGLKKDSDGLIGYFYVFFFRALFLVFFRVGVERDVSFEFSGF